MVIGKKKKNMPLRARVYLKEKRKKKKKKNTAFLKLVENVIIKDE